MNKKVVKAANERLAYDLKSVDYLINICDGVSQQVQRKRKRNGKKASGTTSEKERILLRCVAVFLNMTLEDLLRSLFIQYAMEYITGIAPSAGKNKSGYGDLEIITISTEDFKAFKESGSKDFDEFLNDQIANYIDENFGKKNFSRAKEIVKFLRSLGIFSEVKKDVEMKSKQKWDPFYVSIGELMQRRHHIVHKGDKHIGERKPGERKNLPINWKQIHKWRNAVETLTSAIITALE